MTAKETELLVNRDLFLGLNNHEASFQLLKSRIKTGKREVNDETFYMIPVRVIYRTLCGYYSFIITYSIYQEGDIHMNINKKIDTKSNADYLALKRYCETEVYKPCDLLRNYFSILGLINSNITLDTKHGIWVVIK